MRIEQFREQLDSRTPPEELPKDDAEAGKLFGLEEVCAGLKVWRNPVNKFTVARLHYTADPKKRSEEWKAAARAGLTWSEWMREYEIVWSSFDGVPVYGDDFSRAFHVSGGTLQYAQGYPMVRGWDFGLGKGGMACVFAQLLNRSRLFVYREVTATDVDIEHFAPEVNRLSKEWFPEVPRWFDVVDATGFNRSQVNKKSCAQVVREVCKTEPSPGETSKIKRRQAVSKYLQANVKGLPCFVLDAEGCPMLVQGFEGGYHYPYAVDGQLKEDPLKNEYSHPHDALQVIASRVDKLDLTTRMQMQITPPRYGFGKAANPPRLVA